MAVITVLLFILQLVVGSERCGYRDVQSSNQAEVERFGTCVPYDTRDYPGIPCDSLYGQGETFVYIPLTRGRIKGNFDNYVGFFQDTELVFNFIPEECIMEARSILCQYFFPPCGNTTVFESPDSVCEDVCEYLLTLCPEEYALLEEYFNERAHLLLPYGIDLINCSNTGKYLQPLNYCCSDLSINIPCTKVNDSGELVSIPSCLSTSVAVPRPSTEPQSISVGGIVGISCAIIIIVVGISIGVIFVALLLLRKRKNQKEIQKIKKLTLLERSQSSDVARYQENEQHLAPPHPGSSVRIARVPSTYIRQMSDVNLLIPGRGLDLLDTIGQGEFGIVYRGKLKAWDVKGEECVIAAKTLKGVFGTTDLSSLMEESMKMSKFNHPNVMKLIGVCIEKGNSPFIIMPYMAYGSLLSYLKRKRAELTLANDDDSELVKMTQTKLLSMCLQVAKGMSYLATQQFVHRDLAARNCMIDENFILKVSDFGLTEDVYSKHYFRHGSQEREEGEASVRLPVRWMAVESLHDGVFTEKTDVWSFGVTMWEIFSLGKIPYPGVDAFSVIKFLDDGRRLGMPANAACSQEIYTLMCDCWAEDPKQRPYFSDLVSRISNTLEGIAGYLDFSSDNIVGDQPQTTQYDHLQPEHSVEAEDRNVTNISSISDQSQRLRYDHLQQKPPEEREDRLRPTVIVSDIDSGNDVTVL